MPGLVGDVAIPAVFEPVHDVIIPGLICFPVVLPARGQRRNDVVYLDWSGTSSYLQCLSRCGRRWRAGRTCRSGRGARCDGVMSSSAAAGAMQDSDSDEDQLMIVAKVSDANSPIIACVVIVVR